MDSASHAASNGCTRTKEARNTADDYIMNTNDSSIVSKRSVCHFYYPNEPDFYQPFVTKFQRRNPLINRGYWLRMHAVEQSVLKFLKDNAGGRLKAVVNLGCGYDPLPWQFMHRRAAHCADAMFVDVDYPQLMRKKVKAIQTDDLLSGYLPGIVTTTESEGVLARCGSSYAAVGCDLRETSTLETALRGYLGLGDRSILFVAEVSITYMNVKDADKVIKWAGSFSDAQFCLLEQFLPCGPHHPFAKTMLAHFRKLNSPIHAAAKYPSLGQQRSRFKRLGWPSARAANLWDYWSNLDTIPREERRKLDSVEPFDEWEEFALFAGHYFVLSARNNPSDSWSGHANDKVSNPSESMVAGRVLRVTRNQPASPTTGSLPEDVVHVNRRFAATFKTPAGNIFAHSGLGQQQRLQTMQSAYGREAFHAFATPPIPGRMCHTISYCGSDPKGAGDRYLMVGGRASPKSIQSDYFISITGEHSPTNADSIEPPRFRHSAVEIQIRGDISRVDGVLVFGGKTAEGEVLGDWTFWDVRHGWRKVGIKGVEPAARFGASMAIVDGCRGVLAGGMDDCGNIVGDFIEWEFNLADDAPEIHCRNRTQDISEKTAQSSYARFGAKLLTWKGKLLLIGGIISRRILKMDHEIMLISFEDNSISVERMKLELDSQEPPLFVGFGAEAVSDEEILIVGGGAVCFSMGSFLNPPELLLTVAPVPPAVSERSMEKATDINTENGTQNRANDFKDRILEPSSPAPRDAVPRLRVTQVPRVRIETSEDFDAIVSAGQPVIIEGQPLGPCTTLWTPSYLESRIGADQMVVVHSSSSPRLTFQQKNFTYTKQSFGAFIRGVQNGEKLYLRSVSTSHPLKQPTHLSTDFPSLAADFTLPSTPFAQVHARAHSSPLRISGPVALWLHYDVLANVLCQIRGAKTLRLHPPSDAPHLAVPPGASSSDVDVFADDAVTTHPPLQRTRPHEARLGEGDVLYLPPMWFHGARPEEGWSVAVNVFFRNLEDGCYAPGRDVYGNRDLRAYEEGRRAVERIAKGFEGVPAEARAFYLERLAEELRGMI